VLFYRVRAVFSRLFNRPVAGPARLGR
jgi:hypothetical protein